MRLAMVLLRDLRAKLMKGLAARGEPLGSGDSLEMLTDQELALVRRFFARPKFFVFGHPRSGTTILGRLLRLHPEVHCNWNARFFNWDGLISRLNTPALQTWLDGQGNRWTRQAHLSTPLMRIACDFFLEQEAERVGKRIVGDKTPNIEGAQAVDWLHRLYPDAKLIVILRDGRDAILSMRIRAFIDYSETLSRADRALRDRIRRDNRPYLAGKRSIFTPSWLTDQAQLWAKNVLESDALAREFFSDNYMPVRYEDILADPMPHLDRMWRFLGVESVGADLTARVQQELARNPKAAWHDEKDPALVQGLRRGSQGGWRVVYTSRDRELFLHAAAEALRRWGYEAGDAG